MPSRTHSELSFDYKENTLLIRRQGTLRYELTLWPRPMAYRYVNREKRERIYPDFRVVGYPYRPRKTKVDPQLTLLDIEPPRKEGMNKLEAYEGLRSSLPFKYAIALAPFKSHQWNMIMLLSMHGRFYDLLKSNPVLAYLLANSFDIRKRIFARDLTMDRLTGMPQSTLLRLLELPNTKSMVKLLRKITARSVFPGMGWHLSYCSDHEELLKPLAHLKQINQGALRLVSELGKDINLLEASLLEEISEDVRYQHCDHIAYVFLQVKQLHDDLHPDRPFPRLRSIGALNEMRDTLRAQVEERVVPQTRKYTIKPVFTPRDPPLPGTPDIQPLITEEDLRREGQEQRHCIGIVYPDLYMTGAYYAYRILAPERATVSIVKSARGWRVDELRAADNASVCHLTRNAVNAWLEGAQPGL